MSPLLALAITYIIWGAAPPVFKFAIQDVPPFTLMFIRFFTAGLLFLPFAYKHFRKLHAASLKQIIIGSILEFSIGISFFFLGIQYAPSINAHVIGSFGPFILYFSSIIFLKEKPHNQIIRGILISFIGILVIIIAPFFFTSTFVHKTAGASEILGNIFFFISMAGIALHTIFYKQALKRVHTLAVSCMGFFICAFTAFPVMMYELQSWSFTQLTAPGWIGIFYGIFFSSALAYWLHNYGLSKLKVQETAIFGYISPIVAVLVAMPLLGEYPDIFFIIGALFVFLGIYIAERHPHYKRVNKKVDES